jgi:hypothetical protein
VGLLTQRATRTLATYLSGERFSFFSSFFFHFLLHLLSLALSLSLSFNLSSLAHSSSSSQCAFTPFFPEMNLNHYGWLIAYERANEIPR